jgi:hypothetical protein
MGPGSPEGIASQRGEVCLRLRSGFINAKLRSDNGNAPARKVEVSSHPIDDNPVNIWL